MTKIARIVKSNSHVDYVARVVDELDADEPPGPEDYGFAQFVSVHLNEGAEAVGVVYDTQLANPDYASFGPRLSSHAELKVLSPDFLHEQGVLLGILLVGWRERAGRVEPDAEAGGDTRSVGARAGTPKSNAAGGGLWASHQGVPRRVVPVGQDVLRMSDDEVAAFHRGAEGSVQLHYFSLVVAHAGPFAVPLVEAVIAQLEPACATAERQRLCVLKKSLVWQRTLGQLRL
jgi:hypothetical protein